MIAGPSVVEDGTILSVLSAVGLVSFVILTRLVTDSSLSGRWGTIRFHELGWRGSRLVAGIFSVVCVGSCRRFFFLEFHILMGKSPHLCTQPVAVLPDVPIRQLPIKPANPPIWVMGWAWVYEL